MKEGCLDKYITLLLAIMTLITAHKSYFHTGEKTGRILSKNKKSSQAAL